MTQAPCRARVSVLRMSCTARCITPVSRDPIFWSGTPSVAITCVRLRSAIRIDIAGLVLVEADVGGPDEHGGDARRIASLRECRDAIAAGKSLPAARARPGQPARTCAQQFFRGLPEAMWSAKLNAKLLQLAQTKVAMYDAYISEMAANA